MPYLPIIALVCCCLMVSIHSFSSDKDLIPKAKKLPFTPGEKLKYKVQYNLYFNVSVGKVKFKIHESQVKKNDNNCHRIVSKGRTLGFYDNFYKVRDHYETCLDMDEIRPAYFMRDVNEGDYTFFDQVDFYHQQGFALTEDGQRHRITSHTQDLLSVLYYARTLDYENAQPGDSATFTTYIDDSTYTVGVKYAGKTTVDTENGEMKCLKLKPLLVVGRLFDSKYDMTLWVTDGPNKIPVKVKSGISVGRIKAKLTKYENLKYPLGGKQ